MKKTLKTVCGALVLFVITLVTSCSQKEDRILVRIGDKDSITVDEFKWEVEKRINVQNIEPEKVNKFNLLMQLTDDHVRALGSREKYQNAIIDTTSMWQSYYGSVRSRVLLNYIIKRKFVTQSLVDFIHKEQNSIAILQYITIPYQTAINPKIQRNRNQALHLADSLYGIANLNNFFALISNFSEVKGKTGKQLTKADRLPIGQMPISLMAALSQSVPGTIMVPVEFSGGIIIGYLNKIERPIVAGTEPRSKREIESQLIDNVLIKESYFYNQELARFNDSLEKKYSVVFDTDTINLIYKLLSIQTKDEVLLNKRICKLMGDEKIDYADILPGLKNQVQAFKSEILFSAAIKNLVQLKLYERIILENEKDGFNWRKQSKANLIREQYVDFFRVYYTHNYLFDEGVLRGFYQRNMSLFRTKPSYVYNEIRCSNESAASLIKQSIQDGILFDAIVDGLMNKDSNMKNKLSYQKSITQESETTAGEVKFLNLKIGETSTDPYRNKDGSFSFYKMVDIKESKVIPFEEAKLGVEIRYKEYKNKSAEYRELNRLKSIYPVIVNEFLLERLNREINN